MSADSSGESGHFLFFRKTRILGQLTHDVVGAYIGFITAEKS